jgi:hypothetical protein
VLKKFVETYLYQTNGV